MTDTELIISWLQRRKEIFKRFAFESDINSLVEQSFETGFQAGWDEARRIMLLKLEDMESEE